MKKIKVKRGLSIVIVGMMVFLMIGAFIPSFENVQASANGDTLISLNDVVFEEDFEKYEIGALPTGNDAKLIGRSTNSNLTTNITSIDGSKRLEINQTGTNNNLVAYTEENMDMVTGEIEFDFMRPSINGHFHVRLDNDGAIWQQFYIREDGTLKYYDGVASQYVTYGSYVQDCWYNLKVIFNCTSDLFDVYLNGTKVVDDGNRWNDKTSIDRITWNPSASSNCTMLVDNITWATKTIDYSHGDIKIPYIKNNKKYAMSFTFDDTLSSVWDNGTDILDGYNYTATIGTVTNWVGAGEDYLTWSQLNSLYDMGWRIQSHSMNHSDMTTLNEAQIDEQLVGSRNAIEGNVTGETVRYFINPFGTTNSLVDSRLEANDYYGAERQYTQPWNKDYGNMYLNPFVSYYIKRGSIYNSMGLDNMTKDLDRAFWRPFAWHIAYSHGIEDGNSNINSTNLEQFCQYLDTNYGNDIWTATSADVYDYILLSNKVSIDDKTVTDSQITFKVDDSEVPQYVVHRNLTTQVFTNWGTSAQITNMNRDTSNIIEKLVITPNNYEMLLNLNLNKTDITIDKANDYQVAYGIENIVYSDGSVTVGTKGQQYNGYLVDMTAAPSSGSIDVKINNIDLTKKDEYDATIMNFTIESTDGNNVNFTIGGLGVGTTYHIYKDSSLFLKVKSDDSGMISFNNSDWSEHTFTIINADMGSMINPLMSIILTVMIMVAIISMVGKFGKGK